jgi:hypothetical protein
MELKIEILVNNQSLIDQWPDKIITPDLLKFSICTMLCLRLTHRAKLADIG